MNLQPNILYRDTFASPVGAIQLVTDREGVLRALDFGDFETRLLRLLARHYGATPHITGAAPKEIRTALQAYFDGDFAPLGRIRWATAGTEFQRTVWTALTEIPAGTTQSYGALAAKIGKASAVRAVGLANGSNPVAIVVPCHRVIGADGTLTGYGGGLPRKKWLLEHEGVRIAESAQPDIFAALV